MLEKLFNPKSVAVVGASTKELSIGNRIIKNLIDFGYKGSIYPINPKADQVCEIKAYQSMEEVPNKVDLAHIVIPNKYVLHAIDECSKKNTAVVIINTAGFKEIGEEGAKLEKEVVKRAKKYGMRIFGPNCQGIINTDSSVKAYCNFTFTKPLEGYISIFAQSGGVGEIINQRFSELEVGVRMYASNGNACDISSTEIIKYWTEDTKTRVIVLYIENLTNPNEFSEVLKAATLKKPVLAMKGGRTKEGAQAASSHTGGLAKTEMATELILKKAGALVFTDEEEMCQAALAFAMQPIPKGNRVGLITNTGGPAIIATDELVESGLTIPPLSEKTKSLLKGKLHAAASVNNPIDVLATASADHFHSAMDAMMKDESIDSIFINFVTPFFVDNNSIAHEIAKMNALKQKPIICNLMTDKKNWKDTVKILKESEVPCYNFPEMGARVLSALYQYSEVQSRKKDQPTEFEDISITTAYEIITKVQSTPQRMLTSSEVNTLLSSYEIHVADWQIVETKYDAIIAAEEIGFPVVVKADAEDIIHKSDVGGVALNLKNKYDVQNAVETMEKNISVKRELKFFIQRFYPDGLELIIGAKKEGHLGHVLIFGLGGIYVEVLKDISFKHAPVSSTEAYEMISSIKAAPILSGYRGQESVNKDLIKELIERCSKLVTDFPQIVEMDLNPIKVYNNKLSVVDARIRIDER